VACMNEGRLANRIVLGLVADTLHELESGSTRLWCCATEVSVPAYHFSTREASPTNDSQPQPCPRSRRTVLMDLGPDETSTK
jgi:hypothetical protein